MKSALKTSRGHVVLAVTEADVARDLIERVSTDLRTLFRTREGMVQVTCLLGVVDLQERHRHDLAAAAADLRRHPRRPWGKWIS